MKNAALLIAVLFFVFGYEMLVLLYPDAKTDYNEFLKYYYAKERINEIVFTLLFYVAFKLIYHRVFKAVCMFGLTVAFSSMIDKVFLNNYQYLITDIVIVIVAFRLSYKVYKHGKHPSVNRFCSNTNYSGATGIKRFNNKNTNTITGSSINKTGFGK